MDTPLPPIVDSASMPWMEHVRFPGIAMKRLFGATDHPLASISLVQVPPGGAIGRHRHKQEVEVVYVLAGQSRLVLGESEIDFNAGQAVAIPSGLEHALRNLGQETVEILTIFTPPLR